MAATDPQFQPEVVGVPARRRCTRFSLDGPHVVARLLRWNYLVVGPGSPTYAVTQLAGSLA